MSKIKAQSTCIACSVFKLELQLLQKRGEIDLLLRFLDSSLHMKPMELRKHLTFHVKNELKKNNSVIIVFGDCSPHMIEMEEYPNVTRTRGRNCCEIILGREVYEKHLKDGCFFLMPEWSARWREYFQFQLGLDKNIIPDFMNDLHSKILYLDTGVIPLPTKDLKAFSDYCNLPYETMKVSLEHLLLSIHETETQSNKEIE